MKNIAIILASGTGSRFGTDIPKQFYQINSKTVLEMSIEAFQNNNYIDERKDNLEEENYKQALYYYTLAAEQNEAKSISDIGYIYANGFGVEQNYDVAFHYYLKSAESGCSVAQSNTGLFYEQGKGCEKDLIKAIGWYRKAAAQGDQDAIERLEQLGMN